MKTTLVTLVLVGISMTASAASVTASWDPVTLDVDGQPETISHYVLYYGESSRPGGVTHPSDGAFSYDQSVNVGNVVQVQRDDLLPGRTYYFSVAAVDVGGNVSAYSDEVQVDIPPEQQDGGPVDGGQDAGPVDAGQDAGPVDAGQDAGGDPGQQQDAGGDTGEPADEGGTPGTDSGEEIVIEGSCGCGTARSACGWLVLVALPLVIRRRTVC